MAPSVYEGSTPQPPWVPETLYIVLFHTKVNHSKRLTIIKRTLHNKIYVNLISYTKSFCIFIFSLKGTASELLFGISYCLKILCFETITREIGIMGTQADHMQMFLPIS